MLVLLLGTALLGGGCPGYHKVAKLKKRSYIDFPPLFGQGRLAVQE